ncbi:hypothetical protein NL676_016528 [Syzygium grande]|nr:hypothetical protein NL676_016528 [Syzygium grande]
MPTRASECRSSSSPNLSVVAIAASRSASSIAAQLLGSTRVHHGPQVEEFEVGSRGRPLIVSASVRLGIAQQTTIRGIESLGLGIVGEIPAPATAAKDKEGGHQEDEGRESDGDGDGEELASEGLGLGGADKNEGEMLAGKESSRTEEQMGAQVKRRRKEKKKKSKLWRRERESAVTAEELWLLGKIGPSDFEPVIRLWSAQENTHSEKWGGLTLAQEVNQDL